MKELLTLSQNQIGTFSQLIEGDYSIGVNAVFKGEVDNEIFRKTLETIVLNNDIFKLSLVKKDVTIFQVLNNSNQYGFQVLEFDSFKAFETWQKTHHFRRINLDFLIDFYGIIIKDYGFGVYFKVHHLISDAFSVGLLVNEFIFTYRGYEKKFFSKIERGSYSKVLDAENNYKHSKKIDRDKKFWISEFQYNLNNSYLSSKKTESYRVRRKSFNLSESESAELKNFAVQNNVSELFIYMAAFSIFMSRINRVEEVNIGTTLHSRFGKNQKNTMGMFVNTVPINIKIEKELKFTEFVNQVDKRKTNIFKHSKFNYTSLKQELTENFGLKGDLFDVIINYQTAKKEFDDEFKISWENCQYQSNNLTVSLNCWEDGTFKIDFDYLDDVFSEEDIDNINRQVNNILFNGLQKTDYQISSLKMIDETEEALYNKINLLDKVMYPISDVKSHFEKICEDNLDKTALIHDGIKLTYNQLNKEANKVARVLLNKGIKKGDSVAIISDRNLQLIINILAIIKVGARYIPIDPNYPRERIDFMLSDSDTKLILLSTTKTLHIELYNSIDFKTFVADEECEDNLGIELSPDDQLYVIYTSGTTGKPKGVKISHKNVIRLLFHDKNHFSFNNEDVWLLFHYYGFDFSVWEIFGAILNGGTLVIPSLEDVHDNYAIIELLKVYGVTVLNQVPSSFYALMFAMGDIQLPKLKYIIFGGEALDPLKLKEFYYRNNHVTFVNMYGITETTVHVTYNRIEGSDIEKGISNIGNPLPTMGLYLMNDDQIAGIGVPGEICVYGEGLSSGYLNNSELTKCKFVFSNTLEKNIYRSGDLAKLLPDGGIEYMGRMDKQVKIHGFRIELKEIEGQILRRFSNEIDDCIVIDKVDGTGNVSLYSYIIYKKGFEIDKQVLIQELRKLLPSYMIPKYFISLLELPLTNNGKLDISKLPDIDLGDVREFKDARNEREKEILGIFREILGNDKLGIYDDFFEFGGDSIKNMMLVSKLRVLGLEISTKEVVTNPTVSEIALVCKDSVRNDSHLPVFGEVGSTPIISDFFNSNYIAPEHYNQSILLECNKRLNFEKLNDILSSIFSYHDMLRAVISNGKLIICKEDESYLDFEVVKFTTEKEIVQYFEICQKSFSFDGSSLFKVRLIEIGEKQFLFMVAHHLIIDAVSWRIIIDDLNFLYEKDEYSNVKLPLKTISFKNWISELDKYEQSAAFDNERTFWNTTIETVKNQPSIEGGSYSYKESKIIIDNQIAENIMKKVQNILGADKNVILLAAVITVLNNYLPKKIIIDMEGHGRTIATKHIAIERTVGWFTAIYPIIMERDLDCLSSIIRLKDSINRASQHQVGFGLIKVQEGFSYRANLTFNYLGEVKKEVNTNKTFSISERDTGQIRSEKNTFNSDFVVDIINNGTNLIFNFKISESIDIAFNQIELDLMTFFKEIEEFLVNKNDKIITQSDVSDEELDSDLWEELTNLYN